MLVTIMLIVLHGPDGREVNVNVDEITSLHCKMPNIENKLFVESVNSIIYLTDGKHVGVRESCAEIRDLVKGDK